MSKKTTRKRSIKEVPVVAPPSSRAQGTKTLRIDVGDWLDVMDNEGTWNVAQILDFPTTTTVEVTYDGWGAEYNEVLPINGDRVAPFHTYTWAVKCWAKYKNWPWWPSVVTFRSPGTYEGQAYLTSEPRMFVDFLDNKDIKKRCRCWVELSKIKPFDSNFELRRKASNSAGFETSLQRALLSRAGTAFHPLVKGGTLPSEFSTKIAEAVKPMKKSIGMTKWIAHMNSSRTRHAEMYAYQPDNVTEDMGFGSGIDDDDDDDATGGLGEFDMLVEEKPRGGGKRKDTDTVKREKVRGASSTKRPRLKQNVKLEAPAPALLETETIIEGPHAPSPDSDSEEEEEEAEEPVFLPVIDEPFVSSIRMRKSDEDRRVGPAAKRLRTRKHVLAPAPEAVVAIDDTKRRSQEKPKAEHESLPIETPTRGAVGSSKTAWLRELEKSVARGRSEAPRQIRTGPKRNHIVVSSSPVTTPDENAEEVPMILASPVDEDAVEEPEFGENSIDIVDVGGADEDDEDEDIPVDPLNDWDTTRSSSVEALRVEVIEASSPQFDTSASSHGKSLGMKTIGAKGASRAESQLADMASSFNSAVRACVPEPVVDKRRPLDSLSIATRKVPTQKAAGAKRKPTKLLADAENAALAMLGDVENQKKTRPETAPKSVAPKTKMVAGKTPLKKPIGKNPEKKPPTGKAPVTKSTTKVSKDAIIKVERTSDAIPHTGQGHDVDLLASLAISRESSRRSSMRAAADGADHSAALRRGKTPVWVKPPRTGHDDILLRSPNSVVATSTPFSSLSQFQSSQPFSLTKWCEGSALAHHLAGST